MIVANGGRRLQYLPCGSLRTFGLTPDGSNLYRVVLSTSRLHQVGGKWPDGRTEYRWVPRYPTAMWVLEKWLSAEDYAGPESLWEKDVATGLYPLGPYPRDGEYEHCFSWPLDMEPGYSQIAAVIEYLGWQKGRYKTADYLRALEEEHEKRQTEWEGNNAYIMRDAIRTKAMRPTPSNPTGRTLTAEDMKFTLTADQLPHRMPKGGGIVKEKVCQES